MESLVAQDLVSAFLCVLWRKSLKWPSHIRLMLANSDWWVWTTQQQLANCWWQIELVSILANFLPTVCQHVVVSFIHTNLSLPTGVDQQELTNKSWPTLVWGVKAALGYIYTELDQNHSELNRTGSASVYMEPFGTDPGVYTGPFCNRSEMDPKLDLQNPFLTASRTAPCKQKAYRTGSIWNQSRVNIVVSTLCSYSVHPYVVNGGGEDKPQTQWARWLTHSILWTFRLLCFFLLPQTSNFLPGSPTPSQSGFDHSPYPEIDKFISQVINKAGVQGEIRRWVFFPQGTDYLRCLTSMKNSKQWVWPFRSQSQDLCNMFLTLAYGKSSLKCKIGCFLQFWTKEKHGIIKEI